MKGVSNMRKINKIMMATVSILLTLVLISSCVLSGIFAKYVTSKTASSQMQFEKFGVVVNTVVDKEALEELGATVTLPDANSDEVKSGVYSVTIENLPIYPGIGANPNANDSATNDVDGIYNNLVMFAFSGNANVPVKISIGTDIAYSNLNLNVNGSTAYLPIGFSCNAGNYSNNVFTLKETFSMGTPGATGNDTTAANRAERIAYNFSTKFNLTQDENYVYKGFPKSATNNINFTISDNTSTKDKTGSGTVNAIAQGIYWDFSKNDTKDTWIVDNNPNGSISITYIVKVEQLENDPVATT
jgi:hypothetical protein